MNATPPIISADKFLATDPKDIGISIVKSESQLFKQSVIAV